MSLEDSILDIMDQKPPFEFSPKLPAFQLRALEVGAYSEVVRALRAGGRLDAKKRETLATVRAALNIPIERHIAEVRRASNDETLAYIADMVCGHSTSTEWRNEGQRTSEEARGEKLEFKPPLNWLIPRKPPPSFTTVEIITPNLITTAIKEEEALDMNQVVYSRQIPPPSPPPKVKDEVQEEEKEVKVKKKLKKPPKVTGPSMRGMGRGRGTGRLRGRPGRPSPVRKPRQEEVKPPTKPPKKIERKKKKLKIKSPEKSPPPPPSPRQVKEEDEEKESTCKDSLPTFEPPQPMEGEGLIDMMKEEPIFELSTSQVQSTPTLVPSSGPVQYSQQQVSSRRSSSSSEEPVPVPRRPLPVFSTLLDVDRVKKKREFRKPHILSRSPPAHPRILPSSQVLLLGGKKSAPRAVILRRSLNPNQNLLLLDPNSRNFPPNSTQYQISHHSLLNSSLPQQTTIHVSSVTQSALVNQLAQMHHQQQQKHQQLHQSNPSGMKTFGNSIMAGAQSVKVSLATTVNNNNNINNINNTQQPIFAHAPLAQLSSAENNNNSCNNSSSNHHHAQSIPLLNHTMEGSSLSGNITFKSAPFGNSSGGVAGQVVSLAKTPSTVNCTSAKEGSNEEPSRDIFSEALRSSGISFDEEMPANS